MTPTNDTQRGQMPAVASSDAFAALFGSQRGARALPRDAARRFLDGARNLPISGVRSSDAPDSPDLVRDAAGRARRRAARRRAWTPGAGGRHEAEALMLYARTANDGGGTPVFVCVIASAGSDDSASQCVVRPLVRGARR
jgi:hypothetical protein